MIVFTKITKTILGGQFVGKIIYPCTSLFQKPKKFWRALKWEGNYLPAQTTF